MFNVNMSGHLSRFLAGCPQRSASRRCSVLLQHLKGQTSRMASSEAKNEEEVLFTTVGEREKGGCYRLITLNRPKALNALNYNMIRLITADMKEVLEDSSIHFVVMRGAGGKAYCAGGDIRAVTEAGKVGDRLSQDFFRGEYNLNHMIGTYKKPFVALIDGITMGGGVGLSVHGPFRVATENTLFAMPETFIESKALQRHPHGQPSVFSSTGIGLYPDVGGTHFLPRLRGSLGLFLALTGHRLKGRDVLHAGVATHYIAKDKFPDLTQKLAAACTEKTVVTDPLGTVRSVLDVFHKQCLDVGAKEFSLEPKMDVINRCFSKDSVEGILAALQAEDSEWANKYLEILSKTSPTSLKVTHHQLTEGVKLSFAECFMMEYRMSQAAMGGKDFYEGVRAVIVEKDNSPRWDPPTLAEVTPAMVARYFAPLTNQSELKLD